MKTLKVLVTILFVATLLFSCQSEKKDLIDVRIVQKEGIKKMTFLPNLKFEEVSDSAQYLFNGQDYYRLINSEIKVASPIFQNKKIKVRVFTRSVYVNNKYEHGFLVRTYSKDGKIKDEMVLASTIDNLNCEGKVTSDLKIISTCPDGKEVIAQIENDGAIKILKNE